MNRAASFKMDGMAGFSQSLSDAYKSGVQFLIVELDTAMTFMDVAAVSSVEETVERNHLNAMKAYATVLRHLPNVEPDAAQQEAIDEKLERLKARLLAAGCRI